MSYPELIVYFSYQAFRFLLRLSLLAVLPPWGRQLVGRRLLDFWGSERDFPRPEFQ